MELQSLKDWLVPISTFVTLMTASIGGWLSLKQYPLKVSVETRLAQSAQLEADIKLLKLFTEIMDIAHARRGCQVSEKAIEKILTPEKMKELGLSATNLQDILAKSVVQLPVGIAAQDAAICAIWVLGRRHDALMPVSIQALESLRAFKGEVVKGYLEDLKANYTGKNLASTESKDCGKE